MGKTKTGRRIALLLGLSLVVLLVGLRLLLTSGEGGKRPPPPPPPPPPAPTPRPVVEEDRDIEDVFAAKGVPTLSAYTLLGPNAQGYPEYRHERTGIVFVLLPGGTFLMGSPEDEVDRIEDEFQHQVTLSPFLIAKHEVTQAEWKRVMGTSPSTSTGDYLPVEKVSWVDCQEFCKKTGLSLPTEAQWEYACRAGKRTPFSFGATITTEEVNYNGHYRHGNARKGRHRDKTVAVGSLPANGFGLHEMHGNVWEWCQDVYDAEYYSKSASRNGDKACTSGAGRRVRRGRRGGGWGNDAGTCRSARRFSLAPSIRFFTLGFRPASSSP